MTEKRGFKRRYIIAEAKIKSLKSSSWINTMLINISRGGMAVYLRKPLKAGEKVTVKIAFIKDNELWISREINGTIRWAQQIRNNYAAGVMFDEIVNKKNFPDIWNCLEYARSNK